MNGQCGKESSEFGGEECGGGNIGDNRIWEMPKAHAFSMKNLTVGVDCRWLVRS